MSELNTAILAKIEETANKINDYDQRSAIGMARSWIEHGRLDTWNPERHKDMIRYPNRDQLATDLVVIFEEFGAEKEEMVEALAAARTKVNEPFQDPEMLGSKTGKAILKPKEMKEKGKK